MHRLCLSNFSAPSISGVEQERIGGSSVSDIDVCHFYVSQQALPEHRFQDAVVALAREFSLTPEERSELLPSGQRPLFNNRVGWANTYLKQAGLLEASGRGVFRITQRGRDLLAEKPERVDISVLERYPEFVRVSG